MLQSPRIIDFAICRLVNGDDLVRTLGLVTTEDPRLSDRRDPSVHTHGLADISGLIDALAGKQPAGEYHVPLAGPGTI